MKSMILKTLVLALATGFSAGALAAVTLIQDVRVFDGEQLHAKRSVLIDGARIADADYRGPAPAGAILVAGAGKTLLPGLIDAHVHAYRHLELPLLFGVTTQVDMFTGVQIMQDLSRKMQAGANSGQADLFSAGVLATVPGGHGTEYGIPIPTLSRPDQAQAFVDARIAEGSHFIKIVMEDGFGEHKMPSLDRPTVQALISAAHQRGKMAVVHISTLDNARAALEMGADGLVHLFGAAAVSPADLAQLVQLARSHSAFVIPTFSVLESVAGLRSNDILADASLTALLDKEQREALTTTYGGTARPEMLAGPRALTLALKKAGVVVLAGTDAGNAGTQYGISLHHELAALVQAGLSPLEALNAATLAPARAFGLGQRGRIAKGYKADLLLVEGNPGADISATRRIVTVWKDGVDAGGLRERQRGLVQQEQASAAAQSVASAPALALPADGRISLFSKERLGSPVGFGWLPSTDSFMNGKSTVKFELSSDLVEGQPALTVQANIAAGFPFPWAGLAFMPGAQPMQPADLRGAKVLRFRVRGDGQQYNVSVMWQGVRIPATAPFTAAEAWTEVVLPLSAFKGMDAAAVTMIAFNAGPKTGAYRFQIADVRLLNQ